MKKIIMGLLAGLLFYASSYGQKGNNQIGVGADVMVPTSDFGTYFQTAIGGYVKALLGVGNSGQVTFTGGYTSFKAAGGFPLKIGIAPFLMGYRANFNGFYVEPQIGYSLLNAKFDGGDELGYMTDSGGGFMWAAGVGYVFNKKFELAARFQSTSNQGDNFPAFGLRLGYNFSLNASKGK
jgi:hypothetical protein